MGLDRNETKTREKGAELNPGRSRGTSATYSFILFIDSIILTSFACVEMPCWTGLVSPSVAPLVIT